MEEKLNVKEVEETTEELVEETNEELVENLNEEPVKRKKTKLEKFMVFLQVMMTFAFLGAVFMTISPYLFWLIYIIEFIVLGFITVITLFTLLLNDDFKALWRRVLNQTGPSYKFVESAYYVYAAVLVLGIIILLYAIFSKKIIKKKYRIIYAAIFLGLGISLMVIHSIVLKNFTPLPGGTPPTELLF